ncbi:ATP-grasp domain-containing protein [Chitinimonas lacunae]|uniref:RimK family alpha-L-glutamate ligase n=1 Tax=Chitinimonas lacunae TaxID=1963018 RepID=A0ABV8MS43_9NEIS
MPALDVAILTDRRLLNPPLDEPYGCQVLLEEAWLLHHLKRLGLSAARVAWDDPQHDWSNTGTALFRSTWDYFERYDEFSPWLENVARILPLQNRYDLLSWNLDKRYLRDLAEQGVAIVPTLYLERGSTADLAMLAARLGCHELVIKPVVSGSARLTFRGTPALLQAQLDSCLVSEAMMVQPFMPTVLEQGELSLMVIDGRFSHAIRKTPAPGDFRVQDDHGGIVHPYFPSPAEIEFAERAVAACPVLPLYARVDLVEDGDRLRIMELELVEPELFFRFRPQAAEALAQGLAKRLGRG